MSLTGVQGHHYSSTQSNSASPRIYYKFGGMRSRPLGMKGSYDFGRNPLNVSDGFNVKHLTLDYSSHSRQKQRLTSTLKLPPSHKSNSIHSGGYVSLSHSSKVTSVTAFYEALTIILKADMVNYKEALITLISILRLKKISIENMLQSLTSRGIQQILKTFQYLQSELIRKLSVLLVIELAHHNENAQSLLSQVFNFTPVTVHGKLAINKMPAQLKLKMAESPVQFITSLQMHLQHDDRNAQHYWRYPGHVDVWPGEQPGILSVSSEIEIEARKYPDPITHLVGIYVYKSKSKTERDMMLDILPTEPVSSNKFESEASPAKYHAKQLAQNSNLAILAKQYTSKAKGNSKGRAAHLETHSFNSPDQHILLYEQNEMNKTADSAQREHKRPHASQIETVLDGSSGGSGFKQKAKGILGIRHSSRNSSIASNNSSRKPDGPFHNRSSHLEFGSSERKPQHPTVPTLKIPLLGKNTENGYSSSRTKFKFEPQSENKNYQGSQELSHRSKAEEHRPELLSKMFPTKSQLYSVLSRLNKPEMLLLQNLKRQYYESKEYQSRSAHSTFAHNSIDIDVSRLSDAMNTRRTQDGQEESIMEHDTSQQAHGFRINESVIERARPEDSFNQIRQEMQHKSTRDRNHAAKTKLISLKTKLLSIPNKPKRKIELTPESMHVHKSGIYNESLSQSSPRTHFSRNTSKDAARTANYYFQYSKTGTPVYRTPTPMKQKAGGAFSTNLTPNVNSVKTSPTISPETISKHIQSLHNGSGSAYMDRGKVYSATKSASKNSEESTMSGKLTMISSAGKSHTARPSIYNKIYQNMFNKSSQNVAYGSTNKASQIYQKNLQKLKELKANASSTKEKAPKPLKSLRPTKPHGDRPNLAQQNDAQIYLENSQRMAHPQTSREMEKLFLQINERLRKQQMRTELDTDPLMTLTSEIGGSRGSTLNRGAFSKTKE